MSSVDHPAAEHGAPQAAAHQAGPSAPAAGPFGGEAPGSPALDQPFDADALFSLRAAVAAHACDLGAGPDVDDMILVAHELASNAVRHGGGTGRLRLWHSGDRLHCEVSDSGGGLTADPRQAGTSRPSPSVPGGRGLWIARQLSDLHIATGPEGTTIIAIFALPVHGRPA